MRLLNLVTLSAGLALTALAAHLSANASERDQLVQCYEQLKAASSKAVEAGDQVRVKGGEGPDEKFRLVGNCGAITSVPAPEASQPPLCLGVKIWGQLVDPFGQPGPFVNLVKHKWQRKERFHLWLESAVPVQLALFQNYPEGRPASKQISPDPRFPQTFATIMPGQPYRFPVLIEMDDDLRDELMSLVVVRADTQVLPVNGAPIVSATATATAIINGQTVAANATATVSGATPGAAVSPPQRPAAGPVPSAAGQASALALGGVMGPTGMLKGDVAQQTMAVFGELNRLAMEQPERTKLQLVGPPPPTAPPASMNAFDVEIVMMGPGRVAQIELTLHKD